MRRFDDWTVRLDAYLAWMAEESFSWGSNDCVLFVRNCIREMTGEDLARGFNTHYNDLKSARRLLGKEGLEPIIERITARLGLPEVGPLFAQRGDVVLLGPGMLYGSVRPYPCGSGGPALAIVDLSGEKVVGPGALGLVSVGLTQARRAWRI